VHALTVDADLPFVAPGDEIDIKNRRGMKWRISWRVTVDSPRAAKTVAALQEGKTTLAFSKEIGDVGVAY